MIVGRTNEWIRRVKTELQHSFAEEYTPRETAGSFSIGVFITMLPTLGTGLLLFVLLAWLFDRINRAALVASVIVFNPVVKWGVYAASFTLGVLLLGPIPGVTPTEVSLSAGPEVVIRLLVGNLILAVVAAVPGYFVCLRLVEAYRTHQIDVVDAVADIVDPDETELETPPGTDD